MATLLIKAGSDVNASGDDGMTAIMCAQKYNVIDALLKAGADMNVKDNGGKTPLMYAAAKDAMEAAAVFIRAGADVNARTGDGMTALMYAARENSEYVADMLVAAGADVNARTGDGMTALMYTANDNAAYIARSLIEAGADISATNNDGKTARMIAEDTYATDVVNELRKRFNFLEDARDENPAGFPYKVGDTGPGGGIVFFVEGARAYEVSETLGETSWNDAVELCRDYRGGGYDDWYLPTIEELNLVLQNLVRTKKMDDGGWHWSSSQAGENHAYGRELVYIDDGRERLYDDDVAYYHKTIVMCVRAVRSF